MRQAVTMRPQTLNFLPQPPERWEYRHMLAHLTSLRILSSGVRRTSMSKCKKINLKNHHTRKKKKKAEASSQETPIKAL